MAKLLVMAERHLVEDKKKTGKGKKKTVVGEVDLGAEIDSDDPTSDKGLEKLVSAHRSKVIPKEDIGKTLPWVLYIAISNAKRLFLDIFHNINGKYLQNYVNEFYYKFNRRYFGQNLFDRLLIAAVSYKNYFRYKSR